jgi:hypothetical protein
MIRAAALLLSAVTVAACMAATPELPPAPEPAAGEAMPPDRPEPPRVVWTAAPERPLDMGERRRSIARPFTRLQVLDADGPVLWVRCTGCAEPLQGWVDEEDVVHEPLPPGVAAFGDLAEFVLAVRHAASERDTDALRHVMEGWFTHSLEGPDGVEAALLTWQREGFRDLDALPFLLDGGLATEDGEVWVAPAGFLERTGYPGLRAGFRRDGNRWTWLFLVRGGG